MKKKKIDKRKKRKKCEDCGELIVNRKKSAKLCKGCANKRIQSHAYYKYDIKKYSKKLVIGTFTLFILLLYSILSESDSVATESYSFKIWQGSYNSINTVIEEWTVECDTDTTNSSHDATVYVKTDYFDTKNTSFWTFDNSYQTVPFDLDGNNVLKMWGSGSAWKAFYQTAYTITTGQEVRFDFRRTGASTWHMGAVETASYRWNIQESGGNIRVQYNAGGGWVYPLLVF